MFRFIKCQIDFCLLKLLYLMSEQIRNIIECQLRDILSATYADDWSLDDRTMFELTRILSFALKINKLQYLISIEPLAQKED
jgi:hypothetical protein